MGSAATDRRRHLSPLISAVAEENSAQSRMSPCSRPAHRTPQKGLTGEEKQAPSPGGQDPWRDAGESRTEPEAVAFDPKPQSFPASRAILEGSG